MAATTAVGIVVIGRNEGERLRRCLLSLQAQAAQTVYVDSGSIDESVSLSRRIGVHAVELDLSTPFTAARARNCGLARLLTLHPHLDYVFFVDGDCEVAPGWIEQARRFLDTHSNVAVVFGRRREQHPERSIYNRLCDMEWDVALGEASACGGDAMIRVRAFLEAQGYRDQLICGEEPELCVRLRRSGWRIWRLDAEMTRHDAALYHFRQWWRRTLRGGYGFALGAALHGAEPERHWVRESLSAYAWGLLFPLAVLIATSVLGPTWLLLLLLYPLQILRLAMRGARSRRDNLWRAAALVIGKFPEVLGQLKFLVDQHRRTPPTLIEYK